MNKFHFPQKNLSDMQYYTYIQAFNVVILATTFNIYCFLLSVVEFYFFICSFSYYRQCENLSQEVKTTGNSLNVFANVPSTTPQQNICENDGDAQSGTSEKTRPQNDTIENTVIEVDKVSSQRNKRCENDTQKNAGI